MNIKTHWQGIGEKELAKARVFMNKGIWRKRSFENEASEL